MPMNLPPTATPANLNALVYDIETVPLSDHRLALVEPEHTAPGNLKDPAKIADAIAEKAVKWKEQAALSPITGRVAMIGTRGNNLDNILYLAFKDASDDDLDSQERLMLAAFWIAATRAINNDLLLVSWNGHGFDIPFMVKRSWALKVNIPSIVEIRGKWGMQAPWTDLMREWQCGDKSAGYTKLNTAAGFLGLGQKDGDCLLLRQQLEHEPELAVKYLKQDLDLTEAIGIRMGIVR